MTALLWKLGGAAIVAGLLFGGGYLKGRADGRVEMLEDTVDAYIKREEIDNETDALDRVALCIGLGGLPDECEQLRRMEETAPAE